MRTHLASLAALFLSASLCTPAGATVDTAGGFNHSVEIKLPPAVGGVQPALSLAYNSQGGDGLLGVGWELNGLPVVTRMSFGAGINYNAGDTFAGPDGRLVRIAADQMYRGEQETWNKYVPYRCDGTEWSEAVGDGGPCSWKLTTPDGDVLEFGGTEGSRVHGTDRGGAIRVWALSKHSDAHGNHYTVDYVRDGGDYFPHMVKYNQGNGRSRHYEVKFEYEERPDDQTQFAQNALAQLNWRLKWIAVIVANQQIRKYRLDYETAPATGASRLVAVQEYGRNNGLLPEQRFTYQSGANSIAELSQEDTGDGSGHLAFLTGDVNGDGKTDIMRPWAGINGRAGLLVYLSNGRDFDKSFGSWDMGHGSGALAWLTGDVDGDGRTDIIQPWDNNGRLGMIVYRSDGSGYSATWSTADMGHGSGALAWLTGDVDGDGRTDVIQVWKGVNDRTGLIVHKSMGTHFVSTWSSADMGQGSGALTWLTGDVNGDGRTDIIQPWNGLNNRLGLIVYQSNGTGFTNTWGSWDVGAGSGALRFLTADANGDGRTDILQPWAAPNGKLGLVTYLSTGTQYITYWSSTDMGHGSGAIDFQTGDVNGDGRTDLIQSWAHNDRLGLIVYTAQSSAGAYAAAWDQNNMNQGWGALAWASADFSGDGKADLAQAWGNSSGRLNIILYGAAGAQPDLLTGIDNGIDGSTSIEYAIATHAANVVLPNAPCAPGVQCGNADSSPTPLVARVRVRDGWGAEYSTRYDYYNRRYLPGLPAVAEHLGFQRRSVIDEQLQQRETTEYRQDKPFVGHPSLVQRYVPLMLRHGSAGDVSASNEVLKSATQTSYVDLAPGGLTQLVRTSEQQTTTYERGVAKYTTKSSFTHDSYGNVTLASNLGDTSTDADDVFVKTSYVNDKSAWRLGVPYIARTCADAACNVSLHLAYTYYDDAAWGQVGSRLLVTMQSQVRSDTGAWLRTSYAYDAAGNMLRRTDPSLTVDQRNEYDSGSGALLRTENALEHAVTSTYDAVTGDLVTLTDANGNVARYEYDEFGRRTRSEMPHEGSVKAVVEESWSFKPNLHTVTTHTDRGVLVATSQSDGLGRVRKTTQTWDNGALLQTDTFLDHAGREYLACPPRLASMPVNENACVTTYFDTAGRASGTQVPVSGGGFATTTVDYDGYKVTRTDTAGNVTVSDYDPATLTSSLTQRGDLVTRTRKDRQGRTVEVVDPDGNKATYSYNSLGWLMSQVDPVTGASSFAYDERGNITSQTDAAGQTVARYYDKASRLLRTDFAPLSATVAGAEDTVMKYDHLVTRGDITNGVGRLVRIQDRSGTTILAYDAAGRVRTGTKTIDGVAYASTTAYDRTGKRTAVTYPDGSVVRYLYETGAEHLSSITLDGATVMKYENYNERGAPTTLTYGERINQVNLTFEDTTGELLQQQDTRGYVNNVYEYDVRGMLTRESDLRASQPNGNTTKAFAYDALGQLVAAAKGPDAACAGVTCSGSGWSKVYGYDSTGRVLEKDGKTFTYDVSKRFQLKRVTGETADRTYDLVGRLLSKSSAAGAESYLNGSDGFLKEHRRNGTLLHRMTYDYQGNRTKKEYLGANAQTTWDMGSYKIVYDQGSGKYYHTVYVMGLHASRIAHRTVEKPDMRAAIAMSAYVNSSLASMYDPLSIGGWLPWAGHHGKASILSLINDLDGTRGAGRAFLALAILLCLLASLLMTLRQLLSLALRRWPKPQTS